MKIQGKVWKFGNDIDTDVIIPARYLSISDRKILAQHCMEPIRPHFSNFVKNGDIIVAGENFGCGSSREHAPLAIKGCGISVVIAKSFARIFFRNALNIGLWVFEMPELYNLVEEGDTIVIDLKKGFIEHCITKKRYPTPQYPAFLQQIINSGGLISYLLKNIGEK
ncbi:MAG: 3-isopropylmalate dehydratase small subunit [candidate division WOR-3 bacterium]